MLPTYRFVQVSCVRSNTSFHLPRLEIRLGYQEQPHDFIQTHIDMASSASEVVPFIAC